MTTDSPIYRKAFETYLRKGTPVHISIKALTKPEYPETVEQHTTPLYRWHTQEDEKVRPEHAANDGQIFAWNSPPPTGNPGEAPNCRCWATAYEPGLDSTYPDCFYCHCFAYPH